ncbi:hypothetical protein ACERCG_04725 [Mannheimia sp. E30BD]|uniref:hypothetical protein n=1 Tax=Mannheimia sp. E30BD TaxID=3278708 RepID=UPI00359F0A1C
MIEFNSSFNSYRRKICKTLVQRFSVSLTACQGVNDVLSAVNNTLGSVNSALSSSTVPIDTQTKTSAVNAINRANASNDVKKMFNEAKPTIEKMVSMTACTTQQSPLNQFSDPNSGLGLPVPLSVSYKLKYHKSGCLKVLRINNFKRQAANTFTFTVYYQSPQSEETDSYGYAAIKQPDGEWLFKWN